MSHGCEESVVPNRILYQNMIGPSHCIGQKSLPNDLPYVCMQQGGLVSLAERSHRCNLNVCDTSCSKYQVWTLQYLFTFLFITAAVFTSPMGFFLAQPMCVFVGPFEVIFRTTTYFSEMRCKEEVEPKFQYQFKVRH